MPTSRSARGTPRSNACTSSMAPVPLPRAIGQGDRKSTRLNSSHTEIYTLSLHDALPIFLMCDAHIEKRAWDPALECLHKLDGSGTLAPGDRAGIVRRLAIVDEHRTREAKQRAIDQMERALGSPA